jgi:hypothetical protein
MGCRKNNDLVQNSVWSRPATLGIIPFGTDQRVFLSLGIDLLRLSQWSRGS